MNKNTVTKVVKKIVIGGVVYLIADFCYQMGKETDHVLIWFDDCEGEVPDITI